MERRCEKGQWVEIHRVILEAGERSSDVPEDTRNVPLEAWIKGRALSEAAPGEEVEIETQAGRRMKGALSETQPGYAHTYGPLVPELAGVGQELREMLARRKAGG